MRRNIITLFIVALISLLLGLAGGIFIGMKRGIPFVTEKEQWTIGIYRGKTPFQLDHPLNVFNPVIKAEDITDVRAKFVADPFLVKEGSTWYLFFEVYNLDTKQGDLAVATSWNTLFWDYQGLILDEEFHLSYPYVFKWEDEYYMIPESFEANSIRLYKAEEFPKKWKFVQTLVEGGEYVDNSFVHYNGKFWLFSAAETNDKLHLFYADDLLGPWQEHPLSPIVENNKHKARPSGRMIVYKNELYRYTMDVDPKVGYHQVFAYRITELSPTSYQEELLKEDPIVKPSGSGWNALGMHQVDPVHASDSEWIASVDGFGTYWIFGWDF
jgi:hypothetical protein